VGGAGQQADDGHGVASRMSGPGNGKPTPGEPGLNAHLPPNIRFPVSRKSHFAANHDISQIRNLTGTSCPHYCRITLDVSGKVCWALPGANNWRFGDNALCNGTRIMAGHGIGIDRAGQAEAAWGRKAR
jgi:hypothetical protein